LNVFRIYPKIPDTFWPLRYVYRYIKEAIPVEAQSLVPGFHEEMRQKRETIYISKVREQLPAGADDLMQLIDLKVVAGKNIII
jgi:hypothetical protein